MSDLLTSMKRASQRFAGAVADTGAKTMLKTDVAFLERDIKARKQAFGIEIFGILQGGGGATASAPEVQAAYDACRSDIRRFEDKVTSKRGEMEAIDRSGGGGAVGGGGGGGMEDAETPGIPSTP